MDNRSGRGRSFASRHRGTALEAVPVRSASLETAASQGVESWLELFEPLFGGVIALVVVWRGRDRAAAGLAIFATALLAGRAITSIPCQGTAGLVAATSSWVLYILARVGFYVMAEAMAGAALNPRSRPWWRAGFLGLLGAGGIIAVGGPLLFVTEGWAELLQPGLGLVMTASYLLPVALLFVSYQRAGISHRLRLRWIADERRVRRGHCVEQYVRSGTPGPGVRYGDPASRRVGLLPVRHPAPSRRGCARGCQPDARVCDDHEPRAGNDVTRSAARWALRRDIDASCAVPRIRADAGAHPQDGLR